MTVTEEVEMLWWVVELLLAECVEHNYHGDAVAMKNRLSPEGRELLDRVAETRNMRRLAGFHV